MILKEFDLDAPQLDKTMRNLFRLETRCVTALFERCFDKFETNGIWKLLIEAVDEIENRKSRDLLGVLTTEIRFDTAKFFSSSNHEKKRLAAEILERGIYKIIDECEWVKEPFQETFAKIKALDYKNDQVYKKPKMNSSRKLKAEVFCQHEVSHFSINVRVYDVNGNIVVNKEIIKDLPDEFIFKSHLGAISWINDSRISYKTQNGEMYTIEIPR